MSARVLISGGDEIAVLGALRGLDAAGHAVWAQADSKRSYAGRSRASRGTVKAPDPHLDPDGFACSLAEAAKRLSIDALIAGTEAALVALAPRTGRFPPTTAVGVPDPGTVARATSKQTLAEAAAKVGLRMPPGCRVDASSPGEALPDGLEFPLVVKPLRSETPLEDGRLRHEAARLVRSPAELRKVLQAGLGDVLLQRYMPGEIYGVCGVAWDGRVICTMHQVGRRIWPRDCGMVSYAETVALDSGLDGRVRRFVSSLGWSGVFQLQLLLHRGRLYAIDFNPRPYVSIALAIAAGLNLPAIWLEKLLGETPEPGGYRTGVRWRSEPNDPRSLLGGFRYGERSRALRGSLPRRRTTHAVFAWRDPAPILTMLDRTVARARSG